MQINTPVSTMEVNERRNLAMSSFASAVLPSEADCQIVLDKNLGIQGTIKVGQLVAIVGAIILKNKLI